MRTLLALLLVLSHVSAIAGNDPTRPWSSSPPGTSSGVVAEENLHLQTIVYSESRRHVTINGKTLRIGDVIERYKVVEIRPLHVVLVKDKKRMTLKIFGQKQLYKSR